MGDRRRNDGPARRGVPLRVPVTTVIIGIVCLVAIAVVLVLFSDKKDRDTRQIITMIVTTVGILANMVYSERASRDIRNGVVVEQVRKGATQAIQEQQVMTRTGPAVTAEMAALTELVLTGRENGAALQDIAQSLQPRPNLTNPPPS